MGYLQVMTKFDTKKFKMLNIAYEISFEIKKCLIWIHQLAKILHFIQEFRLKLKFYFILGSSQWWSKVFFESIESIEKYLQIYFQIPLKFIKSFF